MTQIYDSKYPSIEDLRERAQERMPRFAFEYLDGGCNEDVNIRRNTDELREVQLIPRYLKDFQGVDLSTQLFGKTYNAPFGVAPIGLQGLMWPNSPKILAAAAKKHNVPFVLSTVSTSSIEEVAKISEANTWFQLYRPTSDKLRDDLLDRAASAGCRTLVILCDVPTFGFRPRDIRNGLAMPPRMTLQNIFQILGKPSWAMQTLKYGKPQFANLIPYMKKGMDIKQLGKFMNETFSGRLDAERIKPIRDRWKGNLVLKGVASVEDAEAAHQLGIDGVIVSNHGGRQLDAGQSSIQSMLPIAEQFGDKMEVMLDSGIRSGPDVARALAAGARFTFLGRSFMYGVGALGEKGGKQVMNLLEVQLQQVMEQLCCERVSDFPKHLAPIKLE